MFFINKVMEPKKIRKKSTRLPRKPESKPKQFCLKITSTDKVNISKHKELITDFVKKLYTNKKWDNPMSDDDFFVVFDFSHAKGRVSTS